MKSNIYNMNQLMAELVNSLYDAEMQVQKIIPLLLEKANSFDLRKKLISYSFKLPEKLSRLSATGLIEKEPIVGEYPLMAELINNLKVLFIKIKNKSLRDVLIISELQRINHLLITDYGSVCAFSRSLDQDEIANILHQSLVEEKFTDMELSHLAKEKINLRACTESFNVAALNN